MTDRRRRSVLYLPASNARALVKARTLPCDVVILDLEDAVAPEAKDLARRQAVEAVRAGRFGSREVVVRVNALDGEWGAQDLDALAQCAPDAVLAPKVASSADVELYARRLPPGAKLWVMIETARSMFRLDEIAGSRPDVLAALVLGVNDLAKETGAKVDALRATALAALWLPVAAARAHGLSIIDGVYNDIEDLAGFETQAKEASVLGFDGKSLIHPGQIERCNQCFTPSSAEIAEAREIIAAFEAPENLSKGAIRIEGRMVERLHLTSARRVLASVDDGDG